MCVCVRVGLGEGRDIRRDWRKRETDKSELYTSEHNKLYSKIEPKIECDGERE